MSRDVFEDRLRHALRSEAQRVEPQTDDPVAEVRRRARRQTRTQRTLAAVGIALVAVVGGGALVPLLQDGMTVDFGPAAPQATPEPSPPADEEPAPDGEPEAQPGATELANRCTNPDEGYSIGYPATWHVNDPQGPGGRCGWFHPQPFTLPEAGEATDIAVMVSVDPVAFEMATKAGGPDTQQVVLKEQLTVAGHQAVRMETISSGEAMLAEGTRCYRHVVRLGPERTLSMSTCDTVSDVTYSQAKAVHDRMAASLQWLDTSW